MTSFTIPTIETERLILRAPHLDDLPAMTAFFATERSHMVGGPKDEFESWKSLLGFIGHWALRGYGCWNITDRASEKFAGWVGIIDAPGWDEPELGWALMEEFEGQGIAYEAATAARDYAARHFGLNGVMSYLAHANHRSRALMERLGATYEREGEVVGKRCQVWRHPVLDISDTALTTERTGQ
ncbi:MULTISPECIES: GNAT family N-acetyltransferase [unclassified Ruegeria]|uniref:GNAT family N-acetyltransferase n=1 Tax=unclassified Ruegeria TaxID=2625375 RepID=UPI0014879B31|nr:MULTISPECIES: GNAT family N-acetyltransferase [unclassified Ruegeria]NOD65354.1 GNAT family N-acetyltransferase [Ruegeria sp. HKCCD6109]